MLKYPFELNNDVTFSIPASHAGYKVDQSVATIWLRFVAPFTLWASKRYNSGNYTNEWYLITNKNLAMIQTGHSNGNSTLDERKIIANTLYNLAQVSMDTSADDYTMKDDKAPKLAEIEQKTSEDPTNISLQVKSEDLGKDYEWYVTGSTKNDGVKQSDTIKETILSNIAGYKYVIDTSQTSKLKEETEKLKDEFGRIDYAKYDMLVAPTGTEDQQSALYDPKKDASLTSYDTSATISNINALTDLEKYLHIVSVDRANNVSEVKTVKIKDILTKFYITEKYKDVDGNELSADTQSIVPKTEKYTKTFKSLANYVPDGYQIDANLKVATNTSQTVTIDSVTTNYTVTYYYKKMVQFNLRQVILSPKEELVVPHSGYMNLKQKNVSQEFSKMNSEVPSGRDGEVISYDKVTILKEKGEIQVGVDVILPEYYKYAGYVSSTANTTHNSQARITSKASLKLDATTSTYWMTVYIEPSIEAETLPATYSWDYKKNEFGKIDNK